MKQFNLEKYLKNPNRKVITRDGRSVRIVCTDVMGTIYPVLAVYKKDPTHESWNSYTTDGRLYTEGDDTQADLFFASEKHEGWINLYRDIDNRIMVGSPHPIKSEKDAKMASKEPDYVATCKITWEE